MFLVESANAWQLCDCGRLLLNMISEVIIFLLFRRDILTYLTCSGVSGRLSFLRTLRRVRSCVARLFVCCVPRRSSCRLVPWYMALSRLCPLFCRGMCILMWVLWILVS